MLTFAPIIKNNLGIGEAGLLLIWKFISKYSVQPQSLAFKVTNGADTCQINMKTDNFLSVGMDTEKQSQCDGITSLGKLSTTDATCDTLTSP